MSRALVRQVVQAWFDPSPGSLWQTAGGVPDTLDKVWSGFPARIDFKQWARVPNQATRAQAVVFIRNQLPETRESIGGDHSGFKRVEYSVVLQVFSESYLPDKQQVDGQIDALADALHDRAVADHTFGQPSTSIFTAAEAAVQLDFGEPLDNQAGAREVWFQLAFPVVRYYQA